MRRLLLAAALALPVAALAAGIAAAELGARGATVWRLPVTGYDPRDPVRGHFVNFRYDWRIIGPAHLCRPGGACQLCLEGGGATARAVARGTTCAARIDPAVSKLGVRYAPEFAGTTLAVTGRFYVSESSAPKLEALLRAHPAVMVARLTRGGRLIPDRLEPR